MITDCLKIPGYEFWIEIDGRRAMQYRTEETDGPGSKVVSCYIASEVGKKFRIGIRKHQGGQLVAVRSYVNDDRVDKRLFSTHEASACYVSYIYTVENEKRRFAFSTINFEEDELAELTSVPQNLGTIRLEIFRVAKSYQTHWGPPLVSMLTTPTVSEKSKAISLHTATLLEPEKTVVEPYRYYVNDYIDSKDSPWYTVKFFYRPLDTLQAEGIAPAPSAPIPTAHSRSESTKDRNPPIKTEVLKIGSPKIASRENPIVIEDTDEEDSNYLPNKRSRESLDPQALRKKRKVSDHPVVITLDSD